MSDDHGLGTQIQVSLNDLFYCGRWLHGLLQSQNKRKSLINSFTKYTDGTPGRQSTAWWGGLVFWRQLLSCKILGLGEATGLQS
jgi:hypothetical protein